MGEEWLKTIIASLIGGLFPLLGIVFTVKSERKRIIFQSLYADKQILYSKIIEELMKIRDATSISHSQAQNYKRKYFTSSRDQIKTHLVKLELIAPKDIIKHTNFLIESINNRITPLATAVFEGEELGKGRDTRNPLSITDENLKTQCEKLAELLRKDLGVSKK